MVEFEPARLLVLTEHAASEPVRAALEASAQRLGYAHVPLFVSLEELANSDLVAQAEQVEGVTPLALLVHGVDPWNVVALDDASVQALRVAFPPGEARDLAADHPVTVRGYQLVAVSGFEACLEDQPAKRVAWRRLQAAQCPTVARA